MADIGENIGTITYKETIFDLLLYRKIETIEFKIVDLQTETTTAKLDRYAFNRNLNFSYFEYNIYDITQEQVDALTAIDTELVAYKVTKENAVTIDCYAIITQIYYDIANLFNVVNIKLFSKNEFDGDFLPPQTYMFLGDLSTSPITINDNLFFLGEGV